MIYVMVLVYRINILPVTGYEEETYGFLEIEGLQNQALKVKIWVKGQDDGFYNEPAKYMLEEKPVTLNSEGKASFQITTNATYKEKIEKAIPKTTVNPNPQYRLVFTIEPQIASTTDIIFPTNLSIEGTKSVTIQGGATLLEVLEPNEELTLTTGQKIVSIMFSTEDGKDIQRTQTFYGKTHKLWVHTVNMQEETLKVDVFKEVPKEGMNEVDHIIYTHESKQSYNEEKVGKDGLLEVSFTAKEEWKAPPKNFDYYIAQVSRQLKDPADPNKKIWKADKIQVTINDTLSADLVRTEDMEKLGIKAHKQDGTPFTQAEMLQLRKKFIFYQQGCLKVSQNTTPEVIDNDVVPVVVEMAEVGRQKTCFCNRGFNDAEMEDLIKAMIGGTNIWQGIKERCDITDKTIKSLTAEMNAMFSHYEINRCMQKISFLANLAGETGFFRQSKEERSSYLSSQSIYKGRGILQITGEKDNTGYYNNAGPYEKYGKDRFGDPNKFIGENKADLISSNLHYAVDVGGWIFETKKAGTWNNPWTGSDAQYNSLRIEKHNHFSKGLGKNLIELGLLIEEEEEKYFWLQAKMLNGYPKSHKLTDNPHSWSIRKDALTKLKTWFKYDKKVCDGEAVLMPELEGRAPWMKIVLAEAKKYGGYDEGGNNELNKRIKSTYFTIPNEATNSQSDPSSISWCAVFASWCLQQAKYANPSTCRALEFDTGYVFEGSGNPDKKLSHMRKITEPVYGCIVVWKNNKKGGGHVAFYYGKTKGGNIIPLGGNQGSSLQFSNRSPSGDYDQTVVGYFLPEDYPDNPLDKFTPEELNLNPVQLNKSGLLAKNGFVSGNT